MRESEIGAEEQSSLQMLEGSGNDRFVPFGDFFSTKRKSFLTGKSRMDERKCNENEAIRD